MFKIEFVAVLVAAWLGTAGPAGAYPTWTNPPNPPRATTSECLEVVVAGDSIAKGIGEVLAPQMAKLGYCANVTNMGHSGSTTCLWVGDYFHWWSDAIAAQPDLIVAHFLGNRWKPWPDGCRDWASPKWLPTNTANMLTMEDQAAAAGIPVYWVVPAASNYACGSIKDKVSLRWRRFAHWQEDELPSERQANLRNVFGIAAPGDEYHSTFTFPPSGQSAAVRHNVGAVGQPDCIHFTPLGYRLAANVVRATIAPEWQ